MSLHASAFQLLCNDYVESRTHRAGANLFSFFKEFTKFSLPYLTEINRRVKESLSAQKLPVVPMIVFAKGAHYALAQLGESGYEVVGLDWTVRPEEARQLVGDNVSLQVRIGFISLLIRVVDPYPVDLQLIYLLFVKDSTLFKKEVQYFLIFNEEMGTNNLFENKLFSNAHKNVQVGSGIVINLPPEPDLKIRIAG